MYQAHSLLCVFFWISNENIVNCLLVRHAMVHINIYIIAHLKRQTSDLHVTHQLLLSQHNLNWRGRISSLGKTIIRKFMSMIVEWNIRFQGIWICVCVLLLFFFVSLSFCLWLLNNLCYWQMLRRFNLFFGLFLPFSGCCCVLYFWNDLSYGSPLDDECFQVQMFTWCVRTSASKWIDI